jgi:thiamine biosynthesis protein ThiI
VRGNHTFVDLIIVRYAEMGLKSRPVRQRFERILIDNMMDALASAGMEGLISTESGRIYVRSDDEEGAMKAISMVFGVASLSPVLQCKGTMEDINRRAAELSTTLMSEGQSFAVRARREGVHDFTSMDINREVGSAIWTANQDKGISVDLQEPDIEIFVEVRGAKAFIFHRSIPGPGGLPLGSQGKVVAFVSQERDLLAAWLMMKRGCRVAVLTEDEDLLFNLRKWDPNLRVEHPSSQEYMLDRWGALATVYGYTFHEMERITAIHAPLPSFFPLVGMDDREINERLKAIQA